MSPTSPRLSSTRSCTGPASAMKRHMSSSARSGRSSATLSRMSRRCWSRSFTKAGRFCQSTKERACRSVASRLPMSAATASGPASALSSSRSRRLAAASPAASSSRSSARRLAPRAWRLSRFRVFYDAIRPRPAEVPEAALPCRSRPAPPPEPRRDARRRRTADLPRVVPFPERAARRPTLRRRAGPFRDVQAEAHGQLPMLLADERRRLVQQVPALVIPNERLEQPVVAVDRVQPGPRPDQEAAQLDLERVLGPVAPPDRRPLPVDLLHLRDQAQELGELDGATLAPAPRVDAPGGGAAAVDEVDLRSSPVEDEGEGAEDGVGRALPQLRRQLDRDPRRGLDNQVCVSRFHAGRRTPAAPAHLVTRRIPAPLTRAAEFTECAPPPSRGQHRRPSDARPALEP